MSKSLGNVLDPFEVMDKFGTDALRYYCFREVSFGQDGAVSTAGFEPATRPSSPTTTATSQPHVAMIARYRDGRRAAGRGRPRRLRRTSTASPPRSRALLDRAEITQALERIWQRVRRLNRYVEEQAPWKLAKDPAQRRPARQRARSLAEGLRVVTVLLHAYMPESTES